MKNCCFEVWKVKSKLPPTTPCANTAYNPPVIASMESRLNPFRSP